MALDPQLSEWLAATAPLTPPQTVAESRAHSIRVNARARELLRPELKAVDAVDQTVDTAAGPVPVRIFRPASSGPVPTIIFAHGGGWVIGDVETHSGHAARLCVEVEAVVVSVDYRRAPEAPFPAAFIDTFAVTEWAYTHIGELGGDGAALIVAGDSAGGQLAASVAIACRDAALPLAAQLLIYPVTDVRGGYADPPITDLPRTDLPITDQPAADHALDGRYPSRAPGDHGVGLTLEQMQDFAALYAGPQADLGDWRLSPITAPELAGLAPAVIHTAGLDVLRDEGRAYAAALLGAGVAVIAREWHDLNHSYFSLGGVSAAADRAATAAAADLRTLINH